MIFFENNLLPQSDVVFNSESNGSDTLWQEKNYFQNIFKNYFLQNDVTSRRRRSFQIYQPFCQQPRCRDLKFQMMASIIQSWPILMFFENSCVISILLFNINGKFCNLSRKLVTPNSVDRGRTGSRPCPGNFSVRLR